MSGRKINISKYEDNTVYSVHVIDSYGTEETQASYMSDPDRSI